MKALIIIHIFFKYCFAVQCGSHNNYFCPTNAPCCSKYGYCGTIDHCKPENCVANCPHKTLKNKIKKRRAVSNRQSLRNESISFGELEREQVCNVVSNCRSNNLAALTFDDGIDPAKTPIILDVLKRENIRATFFIQGSTISKWKDLNRTKRNENYSSNRKILERIVGEGHQVGFHGFDHARWTKISPEELKKQINTTNALIKYSTDGYEAHIARAPHGAISKRVVKDLAGAGLTLIHWNMDPEDWKYDHVNRNHTIEYVDSKLGVNDLQTNGPIILQHDTLESTCEIQSLLIKILKKRNFNIVTIDECIGFHNITNQPIH